MTRLKAEDIAGLEQELAAYDRELRQKTGLTLRQIACTAAGLRERALLEAVPAYTVAVIPVTSGLGIISGFARFVQSIIKHLGFNVFTTVETDVAGLAEAVAKQAGILFLADDYRFIALNLVTRTVSDNAQATGIGFSAALHGMAKDFHATPVLVIGAGPVGSAAIAYLRGLQARIAVCDLDQAKTRPYESMPEIKIERNLAEALPKYKYIIEATPQANIIHHEMLHPEALLAVPGIPMGLTPAAYALHQDRIIHDPLQIGVATMLALAVHPNGKRS